MLTHTVAVTAEVDEATVTDRGRYDFLRWFFLLQEKGPRTEALEMSAPLRYMLSRPWATIRRQQTV